jgi:hypothetical protein
MTEHTATRRRGRARLRPRWAQRLLYLTTQAIPVLLILAAVVATAIAALDTVALAQPTPPPGAPTDPGVTSIDEVVERMRVWLVGILFAVAGFFATVGGFRYAWSNGDPGEIDKAKSAFRNAGIGLAAAILAPLFVTIVAGFVS